MLFDLPKHCSSQVVLDANAYLFTEGEKHKAVYTLKDGWAICYKQLINGRRQILYIALPGDLLGYQTNFDQPIDYSVMAVSKCTLCLFTSETVDNLLLSDIKLVKRLMEMQNKQNDACKKMMSVIGQARTKNRIAFFLSGLIHRLKRRGIDCSKEVIFHLKQEDIADAIGVTSTHLNRVMIKLEDNNVVKCRHNILHVYDLIKLQNLAKLLP